MANPISIIYPGLTGALSTFSFPFDYLSQDFVKVTLDGVTVPFEWTGTYTIQVLPAPVGDLRIYRETPVDELVVTYQDGSILIDDDLNASFWQSLHVTEEGADLRMLKDAAGNWNVDNLRLASVADPVDDQDAATKKWSLDNGSSFVGASAASASAAATSASQAAASATAAATSSSQSATSASQSATSASTASSHKDAAAASATASANSASAASASATSASNSAATATTRATAAGISAADAASYANAASTSALGASNSALAAAASLDSFDDRYLGSKASDPAVDNDGNALLTGAIYWNSTIGALKVYSGTTWVTHDIAHPTGVVSMNGGPLGGFRNKIINGDFDVWQRATTQTSNGYGSDDRWVNGHNGATKTHAILAFPVPSPNMGNAKHYSRTAVTSVAGAANFAVKQQRIEGVRTLATKTATLTFWATADATRSIAVEFAQMFGTGGSPSANVNGIGVQKIQISTAWTKYNVVVTLPSISGKTIGSDGNDSLDVLFWFDAGSNFNSRTDNLGHQSGIFFIAHVSLVEGDATAEDDPFSPRHIQQELALCQRYYQIMRTQFAGWSGVASQTTQHTIHLPVVMRATPAAAVIDAGTLTNAGSVSASVSSYAPLLVCSPPAVGVYGVFNRTYALDSEI